MKTYAICFVCGLALLLAGCAATSVYPTLRFALLRQEWFEQELKANPNALRPVVLGHAEDTKIVLTADTEHLQAFVKKRFQTKAAWEDEQKMQRVPLKR